MRRVRRLLQTRGLDEVGGTAHPLQSVAAEVQQGHSTLSARKQLGIAEEDEIRRLRVDILRSVHVDGAVRVDVAQRRIANEEGPDALEVDRAENQPVVKLDLRLPDHRVRLQQGGDRQVLELRLQARNEKPEVYALWFAAEPGALRTA